MRATTYTEIMTRISENCPLLEWIDIDRGQLDNIEEELPFPLPAVFISFEEAAWQTLAGRNLQKGQVIFSIRTAWKPYGDTFVGSEEQESTLAYLETLDQLHSALQGYSGTYFNHMMRFKEFIERRKDGMDVQVMQYKCQLADESASTAPDGILTTFDPKPVK